MKKTILVTGGAGFIGANFIYLLLEERKEWKIVEIYSQCERNFPFVTGK